MDASNYVGAAPYGEWVAVVAGEVVGRFTNQGDAERAYNAARGQLGQPPAPSSSDPEVTLACGHGEGAPVNGGCWCCIGGQWATDPSYCQRPACVACGNCDQGGAPTGGSGGTSPQPGAPTSPETGPSIPRGSSGAPAVTVPGAVRTIDVDTIAASLGVRRNELYLLAGVAAAVLVLC